MQTDIPHYLNKNILKSKIACLHQTVFLCLGVNKVMFSVGAFPSPTPLPGSLLGLRPIPQFSQKHYF